MPVKIGVVNYSIGNVGSVVSAFRFYNYDVTLIEDARTLAESDIVVLAGVGNFKTATSRLQETGFWDALDRYGIVQGRPVLGICLGMQLFATVGYEDGETPGMGWIPGEVRLMEDPSVRIPHIGWDSIESRDDELFARMRSNDFYYMHSYRFVPDDPSVVAATTTYGDLEIVAAVRKDNIFGVQFHPEKSQGDGLRLLHNFVEAACCTSV